MPTDFTPWISLRELCQLRHYHVNLARLVLLRHRPASTAMDHTLPWSSSRAAVLSHAAHATVKRFSIAIEARLMKQLLTTL